MSTTSDIGEGDEEWGEEGGLSQCQLTWLCQRAGPSCGRRDHWADG